MKKELPFLNGVEYVRVNLTQAKRAFYKGEPVVLCPIDSDPMLYLSKIFRAEFSSPSNTDFDELTTYWQQHLGGARGYRLKYFIENKN